MSEPSVRRRAAIYARYSSDLQSDSSIEDQVALCRGHARRQGLEVGQVYADRARTSASLVDRDGVLDLLADAKGGAFDVVLVEALDRLSRDQGDLSSIYKRLAFAGVRILTVHEGEADTMSVGLRGLMGELFLRDLKEKTRRGQAGVIRSGRSAGGLAYGYRAVPGRPGELEVVEDEAETVRRIFEEYVAGRNPREIVARLNAEGVPAPRGATWQASALNGNAARGYGILRNDLYRGERIWNRVTMVRDPETGRRVSRTNPAEDWMRQDVPHLRIVPEALFRAAQERQAARGGGGLRGPGAPTRAAPRRPRTALTGLCTCGACGARMTTQASKAGRVYVGCVAAYEAGTCGQRRTIRLDLVEGEVIAALTAELRDPVYVRAYLATYHEERQAQAKASRRSRGTLERAASRAAAAFDRAHDLYVRGVTDGEDAVEALRGLRAAKDAAAERLAAAGEPAPVVELHPAAAARYLETLAVLSARLPTIADDSPEVVETLRELIGEVRLLRTPDGVDVTVYGYLSALLPPAQGSRASVAWGGLEPPTPAL